MSPSKQLLQQRAVEYIPLGELNDIECDDLVNLVDQLRNPNSIRVTKNSTRDERDYDPEFDEESRGDGGDEEMV